MNEDQINVLSKYLKELNELLEKILSAQFGINDKKWIDAMETIENGFSKAVTFIAIAKGKTPPNIISTKEDIDNILGE